MNGAQVSKHDRDAFIADLLYDGRLAIFCCPGLDQHQASPKPASDAVLSRSKSRG
jgi:hypothetical protein